MHCAIEQAVGKLLLQLMCDTALWAVGVITVTGRCRWRLVSAPSIPGLLSLDPIGDPTSLLSSLTMGTEVEVQFGKSLQVDQLAYVLCLFGQGCCVTAKFAKFCILPRLCMTIS